MSTNSNIAIKHGEDDYETIYCHWDGYLSWNGQLLYAFYNTPEKVQELIDGGDVSCLGMNIGEKINADYPSTEFTTETYKNFQTVFYIRDKEENEKICEKQHCTCPPSNQPFNYIFDEKSETWYLYKDGEMQLLEDALKLDYQDRGEYFELSTKIGMHDEFTIGENCTAEQLERLKILEKVVTSPVTYRKTKETDIER